jgi:8-oxo-dGTP pyrophosphatase MutT (NUDIX family)
VSACTRQARLELWLRRHRCTDDTELQHHSRMLALLAQSGDPFARDHFRPGHFTASAFVLSPDGDQLLLIQHRKLRRWLQPGGHVEATDTDLVATARREVAEETGIEQLTLAHDGAFDLDVHAIPALGVEPAHAHFDVRFLFRAGTLALARNEHEVDAASFVPLGQLRAGKPDIATDASVMRAIHKLGVA